MQIPLIVSETMNNADKEESSAIRMPADFRELYGFTLHEFITLKSIDKFITLQILQAHTADAEKDSLSAYVTQETYDILRVKDNTKSIQEVEIVEGITLGCDPEFFLIDPNNYVISAANIFRRMADVGHGGNMVEIRPIPSTSEDILVDNMMGLINKAREQLDALSFIANRGQTYGPQDIRMIAASAYQGMSAGFHLHFGLPTPLLGKQPFSKELIARKIIKVMDYYVGIPSIIPEGDADYFRRVFPASKYGKPGGFRLSHRTLEYRVPGGYLLRHPVLTKGILALGAVVVEDMVSRIHVPTDQFTNLNTLPEETIKLLYPNVPGIDIIYRAIVSPNTVIAKENLKSIMRDVRLMVGYTKRSKSIEDFFGCLTSNSQFSNDIEANWREYYAGQQGQVDILQAPH
jgi:hypothetical protein